MKKSHMKIARLAAVPLAVAIGLSGSAAFATPTQGSLGSTSQGSIGISATIGNKAQITGLTDLAFSSLDGNNAANLSESVCVWSNTATKKYTIQATGSGASSAFTLAETGGTTVPYTVAWANTSGASSGTALTTNTASAAVTTTATSPTCATGASTTATLLVSMAPSAQQTMIGGASYTGSLTLLVTPQ